MSSCVVAFTYVSHDAKLNINVIAIAKLINILFSISQNNIHVVLRNEKEEIKFSVTKVEVDKLTNNYEYKVQEKKLAFDHDKVLVSSLMELRNRVNHTDIVFHLMPDLFTIGELKQVYELLLGKKLINSAFRRKIAEKIQVTKKSVKTGGHRPSLLCKYKEK